MSRCDDFCCNHGCNQGRNCPARTTPAERRAIQCQADTDRQLADRATRHHADLPNPTGPLSDKPDGNSVALALAATLVAWLVAVVVAPFLAGWWHP